MTQHTRRLSAPACIMSSRACARRVSYFLLTQCIAASRVSNAVTIHVQGQAAAATCTRSTKHGTEYNSTTNLGTKTKEEKAERQSKGKNMMKGRGLYSSWKKGTPILLTHSDTDKMLRQQKQHPTLTLKHIESHTSLNPLAPTGLSRTPPCVRAYAPHVSMFVTVQLP